MSSKRSWTCRACETLNKPIATACRACETPRSSSSPHPHAPVQQQQQQQPHTAPSGSSNGAHAGNGSGSHVNGASWEWQRSGAWNRLDDSAAAGINALRASGRTLGQIHVQGTVHSIDLFKNTLQNDQLREVRSCWLLAASC